MGQVLFKVLQIPSSEKDNPKSYLMVEEERDNKQINKTPKLSRGSAMQRIKIRYGVKIMTGLSGNISPKK